MIFLQEFIEENRLDPSYKVFVILMQPLETLKRYTVFMHKYLRTKTYLERNDPHLWEKLRKYLIDLRGGSSTEAACGDTGRIGSQSNAISPGTNRQSGNEESKNATVKTVDENSV